MDLSLGDRVFYTHSNGVRVPATVVRMAGDGLIHLEYYQDALRAVNRQCKMESMCTPPPLVVPHPLSFPKGGGGGPSLGQPKFFRCGSLCCCAGDSVVGHCHLYPLHSWRDVLLTFAEMELDSTTMFPPGTGQM